MQICTKSEWVNINGLIFIVCRYQDVSVKIAIDVMQDLCNSYNLYLYLAHYHFVLSWLGMHFSDSW